MIAAIYARVSTDEQARTGYSLQDQVLQCRKKLLSLSETDIKEYVDDGYSGEFLDRPALDELRSDLKHGLISVICVYDPDRLSRNLTNQLLIADEIEKADVPLTFITGDYDASPEGRLFFSIRGAISAFEKAKIRERTLSGKKAKARNGKVVNNNRPFGFDWDSENSLYIVNEEEAKIIRLIYDLCINKKMGAGKIIKYLSEKGIKMRGKLFSPTAIYRILKSELYCGTAVFGKVSTTQTSQKTRKTVKNPSEEWIKIEIPAIVTSEEQENAHEALNKRQIYSKRNTKSERFLRSLIKCGFCGRTMYLTKMNANSKKHKKDYYYYRCSSKSAMREFRGIAEKCPNGIVNIEKIENLVWNEIVKIALNSEFLDQYTRLNLPNQIDHSKEITKLLAKQKNIQAKQTNIMKWFKDNLIDASEAEKDLLEMKREFNNITAQIDSLKALQPSNKKRPQIDAELILNAVTPEDKRRFFEEYEVEVHVKKTDKIEFWFKI